MNTIKIHIKGQFQDGYIYGGQLFLITNQSELLTVSLASIIAHNFQYNSDEFNFFRLILTQNNWLTNLQANTYFKIEDFKKNFDKLWIRYSKHEYSLELPEKQLFNQHKIEQIPTLDFQLYGMRVYVGNKSGLYEAPISITPQNEVKLNKIEKVFDARTTQISAKSGSVIISSNSEGLFHGRLNDINEPLSVRQKPIAEKTLRCSWSGYDLINYENQNTFEYLKSNYTKTEKREYLYSGEDESSAKISIDSIGEVSFSSNDLLEDFKFQLNDIIYTFNSSERCFFFLKDGSFFNTVFQKDKHNDQIKLSSRIQTLPKGIKSGKKIMRPISTKIISKGCIIEYFDKVIIVKNNKHQLLSNSPVTAIKTFPSSHRYKNIIALFDGEGVILHSMYPFE